MIGNNWVLNFMICTAIGTLGEGTKGGEDWITNHPTHKVFQRLFMEGKPATKMCPMPRSLLNQIVITGLCQTSHQCIAYRPCCKNTGNSNGPTHVPWAQQSSNVSSRKWWRYQCVCWFAPHCTLTTEHPTVAVQGTITDKNHHKQDNTMVKKAHSSVFSLSQYNSRLCWLQFNHMVHNAPKTSKSSHHLMYSSSTP